MASPRRSPLRDPENPLPPPSPPEKTPSRPQSPARDGAAGSSTGHADNPIPPHAALNKAAPPPLAVTTANGLNRDDVVGVAKVFGGGGVGPGGGGLRHGMHPGERGFGAAPWYMRRPRVRMAAFGLRVLAVVLCTISFSVLAADQTDGWAGDSFDRYKEFRYLVAVNVIAFVYSVFHVYSRVHSMITMRYIMGRQLRYYYALWMDQILAYLLMSASSAAASRNNAWVSRFGSDDFTNKASGSIVISFLAFFIFALSSLISAYIVFSRKL